MNCPEYEPIAKGVILHIDKLLAPGDIVALTGAIHALHLRRPEWVIDPRCIARELFENTSYIGDLEANGKSITEHTISQSLINESNHFAIHMMEAWAASIYDVTGLTYTAPQLKPHVPLSSQELAAVPEGKYVVINAGWKEDNTTKRWNGYQRVVDQLSMRHKVYQVGELNPDWHNHPHLKGATNLIGKTSLRELATLVSGAALVITPLSLPMHLAAAYERPCVVIAGGREPVTWSQYPHTHMIHSLGALPCSQTPCWKARVKPRKDGKRFDDSLCEMPYTLPGESGYIATCMQDIDPAEVLEKSWRLVATS